MKKIILILYILLQTYSSIYAYENLENITIISREQWGANESYTYKNSDAWQKVIDAWPKPTELTEAQKKIQKKKKEDYQRSLEYINENFSSQYTTTNTIIDEGENTLAWPIQQSDYVNAIVVHHTHTEYEDSFTGVNQIYDYHALGRAWWDIGYNYIIGYNGEIFEGRKGGLYTVAAHSKWNNISTVSISIIGDYHDKKINELQYRSLEKLIKELAYTYGIDFSKDYYYNYECAGAACNIFPLETHLHKTLVGHRDTGHTNCPGDLLYKQIEQIRLDNLEYTKGFIPVKRGDINPNIKGNNSTSHNIIGYKNQKIVNILKQLNDSQIDTLINLIENRIPKEKNIERKKLLQIIKIIAKQIQESKNIQKEEKL